MNIANVQENYKSAISDTFNDINYGIINSQQKWNTITDILKESAKTNVGYIKKSKRSKNVDIIMLSDMQYQMYHMLSLLLWVEETLIGFC